jgi:hypothetical protein
MRVETRDKSRCGRRRAFTQDDLAKIKHLYLDESVPTDKLGKVFDCAGSTICYWLDKMGVARRSQGQANGVTCWTRRSQSKRPSRLGFRQGAATVSAQAFSQRTLITFLPERPHLEAEWLAVLQEVQQERAPQI